MNKLLVSSVAMACLVLCCAVVPQQRTKAPLQLEGIWWHLDGPWKSAPADLGYELHYTSGRVLQFCPNGYFCMVSCALNKTKQHLSVALGDGVTTYEGSWDKRGNVIHVRYHLATADVVGKDGERPPGSIKEGDATFDGMSLVFQNEQYGPAEPFSEATMKDLFRCPSVKKN